MELVQREDGLFCAYKKTVKTFFREDCHFTCEINLSNKYEARKALVLVHGSGGISSEIELWRRVAMSCGWNVYITDHFTSRGIEKLNLDGSDQVVVSPLDIAEDLKVLVAELIRSPQATEIYMIGFSLGATAAMLANSELIKSVQAYYPTLRPVFSSLQKIRTDNLEVVVGTEDTLTPAEDVHFLEELLKGSFRVTVLNGLFHSFMRPGSDIASRVYPMGLCREYKSQIVTDEEYKNIFLKEKFFSISPPWPRVKLKGDGPTIRKRISDFFGIDHIDTFKQEFRI